MNHNEEEVHDLPIDEMLADQRIDWEQDGLWEKNEDWGYSTYESWGIEGNSIQECTARLRLPKQDRDDSFFQKYKLRIGSRLYSEDGSIEYLNAKTATVQLKEPDLGELEGLAEVDALLQDTTSGSQDEQEDSYVQLEAAETFTVDTTSLGLQGSAEQKLLAGFEIIPQVDKPDILNLYFSVDLDKSALVDGSIVYQWASFVPSGQQYGSAEVTTVVCKVTIGDEYGIEGLLYQGSNSFESLAAGVSGAKWYEANAGDAVTEHGFYVRWEDSYLYELRESPLSNNNKVQGCLLNAGFAKMTPDDPFYTTYDVKLGTRIYNGDDDTAPLSIIETSFSLTLDPPDYSEFDGLDPEEFDLEDVEYMYVNVFSNKTEFTAQAFDGDDTKTGGFISSVDLFINKELGLQDELQMTQTLLYPLDLLATTDTAGLQSFIHYVPVAGGDRHTIGCDYTAEGATVTAWTGQVDMSDDTTVSNLGQAVGQQNTAEIDTATMDSLRTYWHDMETTGESEDSILPTHVNITCKVAIPMPKLSRADYQAIFTNYTVTVGSRIYADASTGVASYLMDPVTDTMEVAEPTYEFGDDYAFNEDMQEQSVFRTSDSFALADIFGGSAQGKGFQKAQGGFRVYPAFQMLFWFFRFSIEMPERYFLETEKVIYQYVHATDQASEMPDTVIDCAIIPFQPWTLAINQYDGTAALDFASNDGVAMYANLAATRLEQQEFGPSMDWDEYELQPAMNGKKSQSCFAMINVPIWETAFFNRNWNVEIGARLYSTFESADPVFVTKTTYTFQVPESNFQFEAIEAVVKDVQVIDKRRFEADTTESLGVQGTAIYGVSAGFEVSPSDDVGDSLGFNMQIELPSEAAPSGTIIYQYLTFTRADGTTGKPQTVGCKTVVGDPFASKVETFRGTNSMKSAASRLQNRTWDQQNPAQVASTDESFGLDDPFWYETRDSEREGYVIQGCLAKIDFGQKLPADDPIFGEYTMTVGARLYANDTDVDFKSVQDQEYTLTFPAPVYDLSTLYEEDEPEDKEQRADTLDERFRFKLKNVYEADAQGRGFAEIKGGLQLFAEEDIQSRWYFELSMELPAERFVNDTVMIMWLTYTSIDDPSLNSGSLSCKLNINDPTEIVVDQWDGVVPLGRNSDAVKDTRWRFINRETKRTDPEYIALWWNTNMYMLQDSPKRDGYKRQSCYMEVAMDDDMLSAISDRLYEVQIGGRFYENDDATTYIGVPEKEFDWYFPNFGFSPELEEEPVYAPEAQIPKVEKEEKFELDICDIFNIPEEDCVIVDATGDVTDGTTTNGGDTSADSTTDSSVTPSSNLAQVASAVPRSRQDSTGTATTETTATGSTPTGTQSLHNGFMLYEAQVESDFWWFTFTLDMPDMVMNAGNVLYQWVTFTETGTSPGTPWTLGCMVTVGTANTYTVKEYTEQVTGLELFPNATDTVIGLAWDAQAPDFVVDSVDMKFVGDSAQVGYTPTTSATTGNSVYPCYAHREFQKIGRNPYDFDKTYNIEFGARVYSDAAATSFTEMPTHSSTLYLAAPPSYSDFSATPDGAFSLMSTFATLALIALAMAF